VRVRLAAAALAIVIGGAFPAGGATLRVENYGADTVDCGSGALPCRSIGRAIDNASAGDKIVVGPGVYGDLDLDGVLGEPGEEGADAATCDCLILVDETVSIRSAAGAAATVVRGSDTVTFAFKVEAAGAALGKRNAGFTFLGDDLSRVDGAGARLEGNVLAGVDSALFGTGAVAGDDRAYGSDINLYGQGARLERSALAASAFGFYSENAAGAPSQQIERSVFVGNAWGLSATSDGEAEFERCVVAGNARFGANVGPNTTSSGLGLFGNGAAPDPMETANCGARSNGSAITHSFWGSPAGPGADPADALCETGMGTSLIEPTAAKEIRVRLKALR
jgi:hypothetical protein